MGNNGIMVKHYNMIQIKIFTGINHAGVEYTANTWLKSMQRQHASFVMMEIQFHSVYKSVLVEYAVLIKYCI